MKAMAIQVRRTTRALALRLRCHFPTVHSMAFNHPPRNLFLEEESEEEAPPAKKTPAKATPAKAAPAKAAEESDDEEEDDDEDGK